MYLLLHHYYSHVHSLHHHHHQIYHHPSPFATPTTTTYQLVWGCSALLTLKAFLRCHKEEREAEAGKKKNCGLRRVGHPLFLNSLLQLILLILLLTHFFCYYFSFNPISLEIQKVTTERGHKLTH